MPEPQSESGSAGQPPLILDDKSTVPAPPAKLHVTWMIFAAGSILHRVHRDIYGPVEFNPGFGDARFSPIQNQEGEAIPTMYAGDTLACALMESVFHDVPHSAGFKSFDKSKLDNQVHSSVKLERSVILADLANVPLRKLGVSRKQLIDSEKNQYPATRQWAAAIHHQFPDIQGLSWISRQDDRARATMLFGDRVPDGGLSPAEEPRSLLDDSTNYDAVLDVAEQIGVNIVPGKV